MGTPAGIYALLLQTAGFTEVMYGRDVLRAATNRSVALKYFRRYQFPEGYQLTLPKLSTPTAQTVTRGASGTEGNAATRFVVGTNSVDLTPTHAYAQYLLPWTTTGDLGSKAGMFLGAINTSAASALAVKEDTDILALATGFTGNTPVDMTSGFSFSGLLSGVRLLEIANAPRPYNCFIHPTQYSAVFGDADIKAAAGIGASANFGAQGFEESGVNLPGIGVRLIFTGNVKQDGGEDKNFLCSGESIAVADRNKLTIKEAVDGELRSDIIDISMDYAVAEQFDTYGVVMRTTTPV